MLRLQPFRNAGTADQSSNLRRKLSQLPFLKGRKDQWNLTLIARSYECYIGREPNLSLNDFVTLYGAPLSRLYDQTRGHNLVLWHGTTLERAEKILEHGFAHFKGVWMDQGTSTPFAFARSRAEQFDAVPAILTKDHFEFVGKEKAVTPRPLPRARFVKREGRWVIPGQNPVYFDDQNYYKTSEEWLSLFCRRFLTRLGSAQPVEVFSAIYSNISPMDAITHRDIIGWICQNCRIGGRRGKSWYLELTKPN